MSMFTAAEQKQLIGLFGTFTRNLAMLMNQEEGSPESFLTERESPVYNE